MHNDKNLPFCLSPNADMDCTLGPLKLIPFTCPAIIMKEHNHEFPRKL